jgi:FHA domain
MTTELILFLLRIFSTLVLLAILLVCFMLIWREFRVTTEETRTTRRKYGQIVKLMNADGEYAPTSEVYPLLALTSLGRSTANNIQLDDTFTSNEHAQVTLRNGRWWLEDRQSRNGTMLNGIPITQPVIITDGDIISIGSTYFRLELET